MIQILRNQAIAEFLIFCAWLDWLAGVATMDEEVADVVVDMVVDRPVGLQPGVTPEDFIQIELEKRWRISRHRLIRELNIGTHVP